MMEYMESKMQDYIENGISEADRCYTRIAELEDQNAALGAQVEELKADNKKDIGKRDEVAAVWLIAKIAAFNVVDDVIRGVVNQRVIDNAVILKSIIYHEDQHLMEAGSKFDALNAELAALSAFRDKVVGVMNNSEGVWGWHKNHTVATWDELFPVVPDVESPQHHLRKVRADAVLDALSACAEFATVVADYHTERHESVEVCFASDIKQHAASILAGKE